MLIVQKYEETSIEGLRTVAQNICRMRQAGNALVVVMSPMAGETERLVALAREVSAAYKMHEHALNMLLATGGMMSSALLAMLLQTLKCPAISFTGGQAGILTYGAFFSNRKGAGIKRIEPWRLQKFLKLRITPIVAGSQGQDEEENITALGHSGSDLTAVALAVALKADVCEIYTGNENRVRFGIKALQAETLELAKKGKARLVVVDFPLTT